MTEQTSAHITFEERKRDHIDLALQPDNQSEISPLGNLQLVHEALPNLDFSDVDISIHSLGTKWRSPFLISSMTAGHKSSININEVLAKAAAQMGWAMGVGSQRRELSDPNAATEWRSIRQHAPNAILYGNLGLSQLITTPMNKVLHLCENLQAQALFIHLNPLQECIQPEGTPQFKGGLKAIKTLAKEIQIPVIIKETGCGFSKNTLKALSQSLISAVDVSGLGGTHWGRIEGGRANSEILIKTSEAFKHWGISTLESLLNAKSQSLPFEYFASGGIRNGLDAAKCLALGATRVGIAKPMLEAALKGVEATLQSMQTFEYQLKTALFCTGSQSIAELREPQKWQIIP